MSLEHGSPDVPEWRQELKRIVDFLNRKDEDSKKLWWVLSALRGPDTAGPKIKNATTAVLRYALGLYEGVGNGAGVDPDEPEYAIERKTFADEGKTDYWQETHFRVHVQEAFAALGLKWDKVNTLGTKWYQSKEYQKEKEEESNV